MDFNDIANISMFTSLLASTPEWIALLDKTQVFNTRKDGVKSRGAHCGDVAITARNLVTTLGGDGLKAERAYLTGLIHDLGHIPYGHAGESIADSIIQDHEFTKEELDNIKEIKTLLFGSQYTNTGKNGNPCFEHNENSVIQYITLCNRFGFVPDQEIILGIISHSTSRYLEVPNSLVAQAVRLADKIAYINYDVDDLRISLEGHEEELEALNSIYKKPLLDPDGNIVKIGLPDGRQLTIEEFVKLSSQERVNILVDETVREAKEYLSAHPDKQSQYETYLTGCNDIMVSLSKLKTELKKGTITKEKYNVLKKDLERELYKRSPIMYGAYEIKARSDGYIRTGEGLSLETQEDRTFHAQSAVGNPDLKNEYIYKSLVTLMEKIINSNTNIDTLPDVLKNEMENYKKFKEEQEKVIKNLPGNTKGITYPEIYTIVNFIGIHSNTDLNEIAIKLGIMENYDKEVLPLIQAIQVNPELYNQEKGILTSKGKEVRESIVTKYGTKIHLSYGLEEESLIPTVSDEVIELLELQGYEIGDAPSKSSEERLQEFRSKLSEKDQEYVNVLMNTIVKTREEEVRTR